MTFLRPLFYIILCISELGKEQYQIQDKEDRESGALAIYYTYIYIDIFLGHCSLIYFLLLLGYVFESYSCGKNHKQEKGDAYILPRSSF